MKILIAHRELGYYYGGVENHLKEVIKKLIPRGHEIIILTERGKSDPLKNIKKHKNIKIIYLPSIKIRRKNGFKNFSGAISKTINKKNILTKFTRIMSHMDWMVRSSRWMLSHRKEFEVVWTSKYTDTKTLQLLNNFVRVPYVSSLEGYDWIEAENAKKSKYVFAISEFIKRKCENTHGFSPEMITIGIDAKKFDEVSHSKIEKIRRKYSSNNEILVLNVGRLIEPKDMETFIRSAHKVCKKYSKINFLICGNGPEKEVLENLIKQLKLKERVFLIEGLSDDEIVEYYKATDIFVHVPKSGNHFGVVFIEAMAAGLPIIAADEDATPDTVGNSAILVKKESPKEIEGAIVKLLEDKKMRKRLSANSMLRSRKEFSWSKIIEKMEKIFNRAIEGS